MPGVPAGKLTKFGRYAWRGAIELLTWQVSQFAGISAATEEELVWMHVQATCRATGATGAVEDAQVMGFDLLNVTDGVADPTWTSTDYNTASTYLQAVINGVRSYQHGAMTWTELRFYARRFQPAGFNDPTHPYPASGPPVHVVPLTIAGAGSSNALPSQVAISVTEKTSLAKHWGRFYVPGIATNALATNGRLASTTVSNIATAVGAAYDALADAELTPVVPSFATKHLMNVTAVQVDDIPDVIRSRRERTTLQRAVSPAPA